MFRNQPIKRKLIIVLLLTGGSVLFITCSAFLGYEWLTSRQSTVRSLSSQAQIISANSAAALAFQNEADARLVLASLAAEQEIVAAALYDNSGVLFAKYPDTAPDEIFVLAPAPDGHRFENSQLILLQPVVNEGRRLGTLYLVSRLDAMNHRLVLHGMVIAVVVLICCLVAFPLSNRLQRLVSLPILALVRSASDVSDRKDYSVRAVKFGDDELGQLTDGFNYMLAQIEGQAAALQEHAESLRVSLETSQAGEAEVRKLNHDLTGEIAERKAAEAALMNSERRFRALIENSSDSISLLDENNTILYLSPGATTVEGYAPEELLGHSGSENTHPDDLTLVQEIVQTLLANPGKPIPVRWRRRHKNGQWLLLEGFATNLLQDPAVAAIVTNYRDITDRTRAEEELRASESKLLTIVENLTEGLAVSDLDGQLLHFNRAALSLLGFDSQQEALRHLGEFASIFELAYLDGAICPVEEWPLSRILRGERVADMELRIRRLQGDWHRVFSYGGVLVDDPEGHPMMAILTIDDITDRKESEDEVLQLNAELEQRVATRTAELLVANRELEAFSYSVSHDLRAPLRAVDGFSQAVIEDHGPQLPAEARRHLQMIRDGAQRMGALIDDLLTFSRLSRQPLSTRDVHVDEIVRDVLTEQGQQLNGRQVDIRVEDLPGCQGDPALLKQVWVNLIANALKFTGRRASAVIEIGSFNEQGEHVFFVRDNGTGFDMKYANKLFGVFQRLHRTDEFEGTGVGLAIVQRVIHRHGGRIWADAAVGQGATFYFTVEGVKS